MRDGNTFLRATEHLCACECPRRRESRFPFPCHHASRRGLDRVVSSAAALINSLVHLILRFFWLTCALQSGHGTTNSKPGGNSFDNGLSRCFS